MTAEQIAAKMTSHWPARESWTPELKAGYAALLRTISGNLSYYQRREAIIRHADIVGSSPQPTRMKVYLDNWPNGRGALVGDTVKNKKTGELFRVAVVKNDYVLLEIYRRAY